MLEAIRDICLAFPNTIEDLPFDDTTLVFKVNGKMFALLDIPTCASINLKCDPEKAILLREKYDGVEPGYHMHKKHWNTITLDGSISFTLIQQWIRDSYLLVVRGLSKNDRLAIEKMLEANM